MLRHLDPRPATRLLFYASAVDLLLCSDIDTPVRLPDKILRVDDSMHALGQRAKNLNRRPILYNSLMFSPMDEILNTTGEELGRWSRANHGPSNRRYF